VAIDAVARLAVGRAHALRAERAGATGATTVDVGLEPVTNQVGARRRDAHVVETRAATAVTRPTAAPGTTRPTRAAAIDVCFVPVSYAIETARRDAVIHRAHSARAVGVGEAELPFGTARAPTTTIDAGLATIDLAVGAVSRPREQLAPAQHSEREQEDESDHEDTNADSGTAVAG